MAYATEDSFGLGDIGDSYHTILPIPSIITTTTADIDNPHCPRRSRSGKKPKHRPTRRDSNRVLQLEGHGGRGDDAGRAFHSASRLIDFAETSRVDHSSAEAPFNRAMERAELSPYSSEEAWDHNPSETDPSESDHTDSSDDDDPKSQVDRLIERGTLIYMDGENSGLSSEDDDTDYDSESDMTDVSPMVSAAPSPLGLSPVLPRKMPTSPLALHDNREIADHHVFVENHHHLDKMDSTNMDLLLRAVLELENQTGSRENYASIEKKSKKSGSQRNLFNSQAPCSRVLSLSNSNDQSMFLHPVRDNPHHHHLRKNMSFTNDEVRKIDRENKILLRKIMAAHNKKPQDHHSSHAATRTHKPSNSSVNRKRNEERIRRDNLLLLRKIQEAKPSKDLVSEPDGFGSPHRNVRSPSRSCGASLRSMAKHHPISLPTPRKETAL